MASRLSDSNNPWTNYLYSVQDQPLNITKQNISTEELIDAASERIDSILKDLLDKVVRNYCKLEIQSDLDLWIPRLEFSIRSAFTEIAKCIHFYGIDQDLILSKLTDFKEQFLHEMQIYQYDNPQKKAFEIHFSSFIDKFIEPAVSGQFLITLLDGAAKY